MPAIEERAVQVKVQIVIIEDKESISSGLEKYLIAELESDLYGYQYDYHFVIIENEDDPNLKLLKQSAQIRILIVDIHLGPRREKEGFDILDRERPRSHDAIIFSGEAGSEEYRDECISRDIKVIEKGPNSLDSVKEFIETTLGGVNHKLINEIAKHSEEPESSSDNIDKVQEPMPKPRKKILPEHIKIYSFKIREWILYPQLTEITSFKDINYYQRLFFLNVLTSNHKRNIGSFLLDNCTLSVAINSQDELKFNIQEENDICILEQGWVYPPIIKMETEEGSKNSLSDNFGISLFENPNSNKKYRVEGLSFISQKTQKKFHIFTPNFDSIDKVINNETFSKDLNQLEKHLLEQFFAKRLAELFYDEIDAEDGDEALKKKIVNSVKLLNKKYAQLTFVMNIWEWLTLEDTRNIKHTNQILEKELDQNDCHIIKDIFYCQVNKKNEEKKMVEVSLSSLEAPKKTFIRNFAIDKLIKPGTVEPLSTFKLIILQISENSIEVPIVGQVIQPILQQDYDVITSE